MDIKLLFQILTPLSMGGSIIGLFGDFGDGWFTSGYTFEPHKEGGQESGLLGHFRVGNVVLDMDYLGVEKAARFGGQEHLKDVKFQINGFGQEVLSINGDVLNKDGENNTVSFGDIRRLASRGGSLSEGSELKVNVKVKRVPLHSLGGGSTNSGSIAINNEDVCTVAYKTQSEMRENEYDLFYLFSTVEIEGTVVKGRAKSVRGMSNRRATCNDIWMMYKDPNGGDPEKTVRDWKETDGEIYLHQRSVKSDSKRAVYLVGSKRNFYRGNSHGTQTAISLEGIIWTGKYYTGRDKEDCKKETAEKRSGCYIKEYAERVNERLGWVTYKGSDFWALSISSAPGVEKQLKAELPGGIYYSGKCNNHRVCVNYPWDRTINITQTLKGS